MQKALDHAESHFKESLEKLKALSRIPSISFPGFDKDEVRRSAHAVHDLLKHEGLENVEILEIPGTHPYVYADWLHAEGKPTLLLYAHHDVQPPGRTERWKTEPFEPVEKDGRLYGRGTADDKAGIIVHVAAISAYLKTSGSLPVNVKLLIEGEEEIGSEHLGLFLKTYQSKFKADAMVLTDTSNFDVGIPTITTSLRGLVVTEVTVKVMDHPLHSGSWGGPGPDPVIALSKMIASLVDDSGRIQIPGVYDNIRPLSAVERQSINQLGYTDKDFRKQAEILPGVSLLGGDENALVKMSRLPSISVNAIEASSRKNKANIINDSAWCKIGVRTVPDMDNAKIMKNLKAYIQSQAPWGVEISFGEETMAPWWVTEPKGKAFELAHAALSEAFDKTCVYLGQGGTIPFIQPFSEVLGGVPALLIGVEDPYTNAHSENESVHIDDLRKSILGAIRFYHKMGL